MKTFEQLILEESASEKIIYFDCEFSGLHQNTTLISIGFVTEDGKSFYAELVDFDKDQINDWIKDNVISNLKYVSLEKNIEPFIKKDVNEFEAVGDKEFIKDAFWQWIKMLKYKNIRMVSDCLAYDWVLFNEYFAYEKDGMKDLKNINYIPIDICTMFYLAKIDPDINREEFVGADKEQKHNSLFDAQIIKKCHLKLKGEEV